MAKSTAQRLIELAPNDIIANGDRLCYCSQEPTTFTEATVTFKLADLDITPGDYTGPVAGDVSGRKITVNGQSGIDVDSSGNADHIAIVDIGGAELMHVSDFTQQALTAGNTINMDPWDIEFEDPQ